MHSSTLLSPMLLSCVNEIDTFRGSRLLPMAQCISACWVEPNSRVNGPQFSSSRYIPSQRARYELTQRLRITAGPSVLLGSSKERRTIMAARKVHTVFYTYGSPKEEEFWLLKITTLGTATITTMYAFLMFLERHPWSPLLGSSSLRMPATMADLVQNRGRPMLSSTRSTTLQGGQLSGSTTQARFSNCRMLIQGPPMRNWLNTYPGCSGCQTWHGSYGRTKCNRERYHRVRSSTSSRTSSPRKAQKGSSKWRQTRAGPERSGKSHGPATRTRREPRNFKHCWAHLMEKASCGSSSSIRMSCLIRTSSLLQCSQWARITISCSL